MCYVKSTVEWRQFSWVGDSFGEPVPHMYADADLAGCSETQRSTTGLHLAMSAEYTICAVSALSKRQGCLSSCTPEAEFVAGSQGYLKMLAPAMDFMDQVYPHPYISFFREDNQAMMRVVETGRNPTMRYLDRVHRVSVANIHERLGNKHTKDNVEVVYTKTDSMCADIYIYQMLYR